MINIETKIGPGSFNRNVLQTMKVGAVEPIGTIIGKVTGLSFRSNQFDEGPSIMLKGVFEGIPADPQYPSVRSDICTLPKSIHAMVVAAATTNATTGEVAKSPVDRAPKRGQKVDVPSLNVVNIAVEVSVRKRAVEQVGEVDFEYVCTQYGNDAFEQSDPLAELRGELPDYAKARRPAMIAGPVQEAAHPNQPQVVKPAPTKKGRK